ncbi:MULTISPECIES: hypothetical protein [unclassified Bacillus (in: firmicutes)]|uniref:hypothetical protein n=1 Tax=unclassified Bacillus (in: firmicutes) TaxID=185979 RepID=UPI000D0241AF|nr:MULTISPECIES: hypothetical protein [unclassified Bacillus (in: firmicutes)]PRR92642.1 hypothetical protein C6W21_04370 [Bacillus sp. NMCN1]PRS00274.1 hypothetical protein C6W20_04410 [Bacillus sp. NMCN6]
MDGQHRLGGIKLYLEETNAYINVPFLAFHYLEDEEKISLFDTINTKAKGIGSHIHDSFINRYLYNKFHLHFLCIISSNIDFA